MNLIDELTWRGMIQDIMPGTKEQLEKEILTHEQTLKYLEGKPPKKVIVVHNKIVNIVV